MRWLMALLLTAGLMLGVLFALREKPTQADLRFVSGLELNTLDPQRMSWLQDMRIAECLFEPLLRVRSDGVGLEPGCAEAWEISSDGRIYTFHLRPEARWSNGAAVTAGDFIYAWRRALLPESAAEYSNLLFLLDGGEDFFNWREKQTADYARDRSGHSAAAAEALWSQAQERFARTVGLAAPDAHTLVVRLRRPTAYFAQLCAFATLMPVYPPEVEKFVHLNADSGRRMQDPRWTQPGNLVSNGPYVLRRWRFKRDLLLEANPNYWNREAMRNHSILQLVLPDATLALLAYQSGEVDWLPDLPTTEPIAAALVQAQAAKRRADVVSAPAAGTYYYIFNCSATLPEGGVNPLHDVRVRRALALTVDRQALVDSVTRLHQPVARTLVPPGVIAGYDPPGEAGAGYDPAGARRLLAEAGYPGGRGIDGLAILYNGEGAHGEIAQAIRRNWQMELGVTVGLEQVETRMYRERRKNKAFSIARAGWYGDYHDPTTFLDMFDSRNVGNNDSGWANARYDGLLDQAAVETDPVRRMMLLRQGEVLLLQEQPVLPIYQYTNLNLFDPRKVHGLVPNAWNERRLELVDVTRD